MNDAEDLWPAWADVEGGQTIFSELTDEEAGRLYIKFFRALRLILDPADNSDWYTELGGLLDDVWLTIRSNTAKANLNRRLS